MRSFGGRRKYWTWALAVFMVMGLIAATRWGEDEKPFHDHLYATPEDYQEIVDPEDGDVEKRARQFKSLQEAYVFVRDHIAYSQYAVAAHPADLLKTGEGSCLGKAALLCSIYRAMGVDEFSVRVITGIVNTPEGLAEHAWLELELDGKTYQQDPSGFLGVFGFAAFPGRSYFDQHVVKENLCFNDEDFGILASKNRPANTTHFVPASHASIQPDD